MSETLIVDLKELETKVENGKGFNHKEATVLLEFVRKIIGNGGIVPLQLMIPKSVADELGGYFKYKNPFEAILRDYSVRSNDVIEELRDYLDFLHSNLELCIIYLAGKALGVDLVKVVEGLNE